MWWTLRSARHRSKSLHVRDGQTRVCLGLHAHLAEPCAMARGLSTANLRSPLAWSAVPFVPIPVVPPPVPFLTESRCCATALQVRHRRHRERRRDHHYFPLHTAGPAGASKGTPRHTRTPPISSAPVQPRVHVCVYVCVPRVRDLGICRVSAGQLLVLPLTGTSTRVSTAAAAAQVCHRAQTGSATWQEPRLLQRP